VVVFGIDGLGPIGLEKAAIPNISTLIQGGAHSFKARSVMPTKSAPNWASMIMGAGPEQHGVLANSWPLPGSMLYPTEAGKNMLFPTIFGVVREQRPEVFQAIVHDWDGFGILFERPALNLVINGDKEDDTTAQAVKVIKENKPGLLFVHIDSVDHALHGEGFATDAYFAAVTKMDGLVGQMLQATRDAGTFDKTVFLLTSDHGGKDKDHGNATMQEITIPWLIYGPGVKKGFEITEPINTFDTAATLAFLLGVEPPYCWIARPVRSAFE
jgi:predicted AlkP superfamily pyrophosphatase or phosphodiesterase